MSHGEEVGVERIKRDGHHWVARVRYEHKFEDGEEAYHLDIEEVAQGAEAQVRGGRVELVTVPDSPFLDEEEVRHIARKATEYIESDT